MSDGALPPVHLIRVLEGLATNPMLPPDFVRRLLAHRKGHGSLAGRPDLSDGMIAEIIALDEHWFTHSLALNRGLPHAFRMTLAGHPDPGIRAALVVGADGGARRELFERLLGDPDPQVREHLAGNDRVPEDLRARLAADPEPGVRATLAQSWTQAPETVRRLLLTDPEDTVRAAACATYYRHLPHPVPPADLLTALLADPVTRAGAVRHCTLDAGTARRLAEDPDQHVREEVAGHPGLPPPLRDVLAEDPCPQVRLRVFARRDTPEPARAAIHARLLSEVPPRDWLTAPTDLDDDALEQQLMSEMARMQLRTLRLPWVTADPLPHVDSPYACFRASAAGSDRLPAPVVARLLDDEDSGVRTTMALHARDRIDPATAERIDRTYRPEKKTRWRPADDFPLPADVLRRLATDPDPRMRQLAPRDPALPVELVRSLAADSDPTVRHAIVAHPRLPVGELVRLLTDPSEQVAAAAAAHPGLPTEHMDRILTCAGL
ncbi:hypothetical protein ACFVZC_20830 [Streptomyces marokkonensis]|uniref:Leucine rich repeat variant n=1 Tax=Streptomyces marokkonensis TaxID=324855 RepID=A0ABW6Q9X1_9ACTN